VAISPPAILSGGTSSERLAYAREIVVRYDRIAYPTGSPPCCPINSLSASASVRRRKLEIASEEKIMQRVRVGLIALVVALGVSGFVTAADQVPYPEGYRGWFHVKSQIATKDHPRFAQIGGIHHIYANSAGVTGYQTGTFPDGSVLILDVFALDEKDGSLVEGERRWLGVMLKDREKYKDTGGWGFENFAGNSKTDREVSVNGPIERCFSCHEGRKDSDLVFSKLRQ
jgi:hypothetical protein